MNFRLLAAEGLLGWPMVKERLASLAERTLDVVSGMHGSSVLAETVQGRCDKMLKQIS